LKFGLDPNWVAKNSFAIVKPMSQEEAWQHMPPDPRDKEKNYPYEIISRDPKQVVEAIVAEQKGFQYAQRPNIDINKIEFNLHNPLIGKNKNLRAAISHAPPERLMPVRAP
jgi:hypothetical protein